MIIIDPITVAVETAVELKTVLEANNAYTTVYLASNIQLITGINILATKSSITIDGLYPLDGTGVIHTLTDMSSASQSDNIGVRSGSSIALTVKNLIIQGINYYGTFCIYEGSQYNGVTVIFDHVNYTGPQMLWNPNGLTRFMDCNIAISKSAICDAQEIGEVCKVEIGGNTIITHNSTSNAAFWFRGDANKAYFTVLEHGKFTLISSNYLFYTSYNIPINIMSNSTVVLDTKYGLSYDSWHHAASVLVDTSADVKIIQNSYRSGSATLYCSGAFTVNTGAKIYMQANFANAGPLVQFDASASSLNLNNPLSAVFYNNSASAFAFSNATPFTIKGGQINYWSTASPIGTAGTVTDIPKYSWRKEQDELASISGSATSGATTVSLNNFTPEELLKLPGLSNLQLHTVRVFSVGNLPLTISSITDDGYPIEGITSAGAGVFIKYTQDSIDYEFNGTAEADGSFEIQTTTEISAETTVKVTANIPFLLTTFTKDSIPAGELILHAAPERIAFEVVPISTSPVILLRRQEKDISLTVRDTRVRSNSWVLSATIDKDMKTSDGLHSLPEALVFVNNDSEIVPLSEQPLVIFNGESNGGINRDTIISWNEDKGILLQVVEEPFYNGKEYSTFIEWTLDHI